ncbi:hypothetical protein ABXY35_08335 [Citrobacter freundii]|uniref:hypothetical protein n=1 Tax=Citrobacter freundii TaxID=546 RepID=UPI002020EB87|nr:hypothetical protein [Citrobacter freundii]
MSKRKSKIYENPGLDSTIFVEPQQIANTANAFREVVNSLNNGYLDVHDVRRNVLYTNATLAIELYFKAFLVKRIPAPYDFTIENGQATKAEFDDENRVTNWHSRLDLLEEHKTHNLKKLFNALSDTQKNVSHKRFCKHVTRSRPLRIYCNSLTLLGTTLLISVMNSKNSSMVFQKTQILSIP